jgi:hypothetical protein
MINVLETTNVVVDNSSLVKISTESIKRLVESVKPENLEISELNLFAYNWPLETALKLIMVFNSINYCFWAKKDEPKWTVKIGNKQLDGAIALFRCLEEEVKRNSDILSGDELADLSADHLNNILRGNVVIPLFNERLECLREMGKMTESKFRNDLLKVFNESENDAIKLVDLIVSSFPKFNDVSNLKGKDVAFYKRAQLNSKMVNDLLVANGKEELKNLDKLTAFADYKIPQILRRFGVLEYVPELANKVDNMELIQVNSREEIEIRANMIWAVEFIKQELKKKFDFVTSSHVDSMLWSMSQTKTPDEKPYHRTLTTAY